MSNKDAEPFLDPVDLQLYVEYKLIVKNPMDLKTIKENLKSYPNSKIFFNDL